ncbi:LysR family transcriptional regulator [Streptomyces sp. Mg1]|uniref:LysR family transcriptional regulator n=1 Tax=Streptomyces sp. Mg1 TaxID=465541 RepID=UPI00017E94A4|nr:LysR family transcriptional regulator [Streptomyces sp. Mg1]EDX22977.1 LysR-family transcriptional regulator [Streptomyces sp. Mg1]
MIEARHLRVLRAVAGTGSFSAAARELGCTQPAVSQQMKALEQSAGTPLLIRTGREMRLTQAGEALVRHAAGILAGLTAAEEEVAAIAGLRAGRVRLVSFPSGSSTLVPTALAAMRAEHPGTRISLVEAEPPRSVEMLREGDCDVALAFRYGGAAHSAAEWEDLVVLPLLTDRLVGLVPDGHRLAGAERVGMAELADEPWIAGCPRCRRHLADGRGRGHRPGLRDRACLPRRAVVHLRTRGRARGGASCSGRRARKRSFRRLPAAGQWGAIGPIEVEAGIRRCRARPISSSRSSSVRPPHTP